MIVQGSVRTKAIYETPSNRDGVRILATRYWPRGVSRESIDEYVIDLAPSRDLLHQYREGQYDWRVFRDQYLLEMSSVAALGEIHRIAKLARSETVTLMCVCKHEDRCHRSLLRDIIVKFDD